MFRVHYPSETAEVELKRWANVRPWSVAALVADFSGGPGPRAAAGGKPLYRKAHVFFSSPVPPAQLTVGPHNPPINFITVCSSCGILCPTAAAAPAAFPTTAAAAAAAPTAAPTTAAAPAAAAAALLVATAQGPGPRNVPLYHLNLNCFGP